MRPPRPRLVAALVLVTAAVCGPAAVTHSEPPDGGENFLLWGRESPAPLPDGVRVVVNPRPFPGYTCTTLTILVIDDDTGHTLATTSHENPDRFVTADYTGLGSGVRVRVKVEAEFSDGTDVDSKDLEEWVTTQ